MEKRDIHGVVFDMDGLMFDSERIVKYSWDVAGERMGYGKLGDNIFYTLGFNVDKRKRHFQDTYGEDFPFEQFREEYRNCLLYTSLVKKGQLAVFTAGDPATNSRRDEQNVTNMLHVIEVK